MNEFDMHQLADVLMTAREQVAENFAKPTAPEIDQALERVARPAQTRILGRVESDFVQWANIVREGIPQISRPMLCSRFIFDALYKRNLVQAAEAIRIGNISMFSFSYDLSMGFMQISSAIPDAEKYIAGRSAEFFSKAVQATGKEYISSLSDQADAFIRLEQVDSDSARLLQQDPTGYTLLESRVAQIRDWKLTGLIPPGLFDGLIPEFVLFGAESAHAVYHKIYPLSEMPKTPRNLP